MIVQSVPYPVGATVSYFTNDGATAPLMGCASFPAAFYDSTGNKTWVAWEAWTGSERAVKVQTYDHATTKWSVPYIVSTDTLANDDHGPPQICMDADGYVHCFFGVHFGPVKYAVSIRPRDPTAWQQRATIDSTATYPHPVMVGSTLYLFLRTWDGTSDAYWTRYKASVSGGVATWGSPQNVAYFSGGRFYQSSCHVVGTKIHFTATYANAVDSIRSNIYHFVYNTADDSVANSDGSVTTAIASQPVSKTTADASYQVAAVTQTDIPAFCITPDGTLHVAYIASSASPWTIKYQNNSGSGWSTATTLGSISGSAPGGGYIEVLALVPRADNSVEFWFPDDPSALFTEGGDMKQMVRPSGGSFGSSTTILSAGSKGLARPSQVRGANDALFLLFSEVASDALDSSAGNLKLYAYGSSGSVTLGVPVFSSAATIVSDSGFYGVGDVLTVSFAHNGTSTTYQWKQDGVNIGGATGPTYTVVSGDLTHNLTVVVTGTNIAGSTNSTSAPVGPIVNPTYTGQTVTLSDASNLTLADASSVTISSRTA